MGEQKMTPKSSETGLEYIREMVSCGFLKKNNIPPEETAGLEELEKNGTLPEGVYPTTGVGGAREFCRVESAAPDMTGEEIDRLIQLRKANDIHTIRNWIIFFGVMAVIGLIFGGISLFMC